MTDLVKQGIIGDYNYSGNGSLVDGGYNVVKYQEFDVLHHHPWDADEAFTSTTSILYNFTSGGASVSGWNTNNGTAGQRQPWIV